MAKDTSEKAVREAVALLTDKERQFVGLLAEIRSTEAIASHLSISSRAVLLRRRVVMDKLGFTSTQELLQFALLAQKNLMM